ncbi:MAG: KamA family radical SAM protein [Candidatus Omnitrophota bacterium]
MGNDGKIVKSVECAEYVEYAESEDPPGIGVAAREECWQAACAGSTTCIEELASFLPFKPKEKTFLKQVIKNFHMRIPKYFLSLIQDPANYMDPIRRQCVPSLEEITQDIHEMIDPLSEEKTAATPFLIHRYPDRALLLVTGRCFMYCRHCTRKRLWKSKMEDTSIDEIEQSLEYVRENSHIREIIVSGGDPLTLPTERLDYILSLISRIKSVGTVRIGTRAPVVLPQRVDGELCRMLEKYDNLWVNVQFNHPREITPESARACRRLQRCGIPVSNQSVLLRGVNDDFHTMLELNHKLQDIRVRPYYLYQCDPVVGAAHFRTSVFKGVEIIEKMRGHTSGMCVPTFVVDGTEAMGKVPLGPNYLISMSDEGIVLRNYENKTFYYHNPK